MSNREVGPVAKELIAAKKRIEDPANWGTNAFLNGKQMCAVGAIKARPGYRFLTPAYSALFQAAKKLGFENPVYCNDKYGHPAVMRMYDHAINRALSEGK